MDDAEVVLAGGQFEVTTRVVNASYEVRVKEQVYRGRALASESCLPYERPYWMDRLVLEAGLLGKEEGRLVVYYPRLGTGDRFMVYDIGFRDM